MRPSHLISHFANVRLHAIDFLFHDRDSVACILDVIVDRAAVLLGFASLINAHSPKQAHRENAGDTARSQGLFHFETYSAAGGAGTGPKSQPLYAVAIIASRNTFSIWDTCSAVS